MTMKMYHDKCLGCTQSKCYWKSKEEAVTAMKNSKYPHKWAEPLSVGDQGCELSAKASLLPVKGNHSLPTPDPVLVPDEVKPTFILSPWQLVCLWSFISATCLVWR